MSDVRRCISFCRRVLEICLIIAVVPGIVLHATVRDGIWPLSAVYYALPPAVLVVFAFGGSVVATGVRKPIWQTCLAGITAWWLIADFGTHASTRESAPESFRIISWNIFYDRMGSDRVTKVIDELDADVNVLIEAGPRAPLEDRIAFWAERFPSRSIGSPNGQMIVVSRYPVTSHGHIDGFYTIGRATIAMPNGPLELVICHPRSTPTYDRGPVLRRVAACVESLIENGSERIIVCGDMNTPADSVHFDRLRKTMTLAHEVPGGPYQPTWPMPVPVLTLDHVWFSKGVRVTGDGCRHPWTIASDHVPVVVEFEATSDRMFGGSASTSKVIEP